MGTDSALIALAIFAHAWVGRLAPAPVANIVGWVVVVITVLLLARRLLPGL